MAGTGNAPIFMTVTREVALEKWAGWWTQYIEENFGGSASRAARAIFGVNDKGAPRYGSQANKWPYAHKNALPSYPALEAIKKHAKIKDDKVFLDHNLAGRTELLAPRKARRQKKSNGAGSDPMFTVDNPDVPKPNISFQSSEEFDGLYDFELTAVLPMSGVLAIMAMLDDAHD